MSVKFTAAFLLAQRKLGMLHYAVEFEADDAGDCYASIQSDPEECTALVKCNGPLCIEDNVEVPAGIHEALHLLLADLLHAAKENPQMVRIEQERVVRRLEPLVVAALTEKTPMV